MPIYMKYGDIKGEVLEAGHKEWILIESMSIPVFRSIPQHAKGHERSRGSSSAGDVPMMRHLDKASPKVFENCCKGEPCKKVELHFTSTVKGKEEPFLKIELENVLISSYAMSHSSGGDRPMESLSLNYTKVSYTYIVIDTETSENKGEVPAKFNFEEMKAG